MSISSKCSGHRERLLSPYIIEELDEKLAGSWRSRSSSCSEPFWEPLNEDLPHVGETQSAAMLRRLTKQRTQAASTVSACEGRGLL